MKQGFLFSKHNFVFMNFKSFMEYSPKCDCIRENGWEELPLEIGKGPGGASAKEPTCQYRRHRRHGLKISWRRA